MIKFSFSGLTKFFALLFLFLFYPAFYQARAQERQLQLVQQSVKALTDVMTYDITSPPVASRNYAYSLIAFYEAARQANPHYPSFAGRLNGLDSIPAISREGLYDWLVAGTAAFYKTAYAFIFSKSLFQQSWDSVHAQLKDRTSSQQVYESSMRYGELVADHILKWARADNYLQIRSMQRFTVSRDVGNWQQTPPDYLEAIEPNWSKMRPMILPKADVFLLPRPPMYKTEAFLKECRLVYETSKSLTQKQKDEADFWDCNPFATETVGHFMYSVKKLSPGGHWIEIAGIAVRQKKQALAEALHTYCLVAITIYDAFIATWTEKFSSNYIRPVTAIQRLISPTWQPRLQTPPFPEYPSGHSVVSTAAAVVLTKIFGDKFTYVDVSERAFGLADRRFKSFYEAANEAAMSRLYGGIHFLPAIENGKVLGRRIGNFVLEKTSADNEANLLVP